MLRKALAVASAAGLLAMLLVLAGATSAVGEPGGGACQLSGTATFSPNGPGTTQTFGYTVAGQLSGCQSNVEGAPTSGSIGVGQEYIVSTPDGPATYVAPAATGSGAVPVNSCLGGNTEGTGVVTWPDGTNTIVDYTTSSVTSAVSLQGTVVESVTLTLVSGPVGSPATHTLTTNNPSFPVGDGAQGAIRFSSSDPAACTTSEGISSVTLDGVVGIGHTE